MKIAVGVALWVIFWGQFSLASECVNYFEDTQTVQIFSKSKQQESELIQVLQDLGATDIQILSERNALVTAKISSSQMSVIRTLPFIKRLLVMENTAPEEWGTQRPSEFAVDSVDVLPSSAASTHAHSKNRKFHKDSLILIEKLEELRIADLTREQRTEYFQEIVMQLMELERVEALNDKDILSIASPMFESTQPVVDIVNEFLQRYQYAPREL